MNFFWDTLSHFGQLFCFGRSQWILLVSCRKLGKVTQVPAPDPKCKLNVSLSLTCFPYTSITISLPQMCQGYNHCAVTANDRGGWKGWHGGGPGSFMLKFGLRGKGWDWNSLYFLFCFCAVVNCSSWLVHDSCSIYFFVPFLLSVSGPFN